MATPASTEPRQWVVIVLDGLGVGALPDAAQYGDSNTNTLAHIGGAATTFPLPNLQQLGLGNITSVPGLPPADNPVAWGRMAARSAGKDSTTGHWELAGLITPHPFPVYPMGFPDSIIDSFTELTGFGCLGNTVASGTQIIEDLGAEHQRTGLPIVYTSADSVFQIAAHIDVIPLSELYRICEICRNQLLTGEHAVSRVIARPFKGERGNFVRTTDRRDFSLPPSAPTLLDQLQQQDVETIGVGKIDDLFNGRGLDEKLHTRSNQEGIDVALMLMQRPLDQDRFIFVNLVDFDMLWGHRMDPAGFRQGLIDFDRRLPELLAAVGENNYLVLTADHGNDPTGPGTDHSREYVPLLVWTPGLQEVALGIRESFGDLAVTVADYFEIQHDLSGESFLTQLQKAIVKPPSATGQNQG
jgi:phosphopentomutase